MMKYYCGNIKKSLKAIRQTGQDYVGIYFATWNYLYVLCNHMQYEMSTLHNLNCMKNMRDCHPLNTTVVD